jgi:hypothetical protein
MIQVTAEQLSNDVYKYLSLAEEQDVLVTDYGDKAVKITATNKGHFGEKPLSEGEKARRVAGIMELCGILEGSDIADMTRDELRKAILTEKYGSDIWK